MITCSFFEWIINHQLSEMLEVLTFISLIPNEAYHLTNLLPLSVASPTSHAFLAAHFSACRKMESAEWEAETRRHLRNLNKLYDFDLLNPQLLHRSRRLLRKWGTLIYCLSTKSFKYQISRRAFPSQFRNIIEDEKQGKEKEAGWEEFNYSWQLSVRTVESRSMLTNDGFCRFGFHVLLRRLRRKRYGSISWQFFRYLPARKNQHFFFSSTL